MQESMSASLTQHLKGGKQLLEQLEPITALSDRVVRILGCNPGSFTLVGTNTYLIGTGAKRILWDTGEGKEEYVDLLRKAMNLHGCTSLEAIVISHWHYDHLGGVPSIMKAFFGVEDKMASPLPIPVFKFMPEEEEETFQGEGAIKPFEIWPRKQFTPLNDGQEIVTQGATLKIHFAPGHANDHVVAVLKEDNSMLTADNVLGQGTGVFRDLWKYIESLQRMIDLNPGKLLPGHGPHVAESEGVEKIKSYVKHRMARVEQVQKALQDELNGSTTEELTRKIYPQDLDEKLIPPAMRNTLNVLEFLSAKKEAQKIGEKWLPLPPQQQKSGAL